MTPRAYIFSILTVFLTALVSCVPPARSNLELMAPPEAVVQHLLPKAPALSGKKLPYNGILYVTDREPATGVEKRHFYGSTRGTFLRAGIGTLKVKAPSLGEQLIDTLPILPTTKDKLSLRVENVKELGVLKSSNIYGELAGSESYIGAEEVDKEFAHLINQKLKLSKQKDIFIFVHGYRNYFENPLLVAGEMWHYMGNDGVFIGYSWTSTPSLAAYMKDVETARLSGAKFRRFLEYVSSSTNAERVHIIAHSAGTRVALTALHELSLKNTHTSQSQLRSKYKLGQVALVASDYDTQQFASSAANGMLQLPERITVYMSRKDDALGISKILFRQDRLGQFASGKANPQSDHVVGWLKKNRKLNFVDVSGDKRSFHGSGHEYFRSSPWISSDLQVLLRSGRSPKKRGLAKQPEELYWSFPENYEAKLRQAFQN